MRERREKERAREKSIERECRGRENTGERECTGRRGFESETRESRRVDATNAGFETRI